MRTHGFMESLEMKEVIKIENLEKDVLNIKWRVTKMCNLHCSYCIQQNTRKQIDMQKLKKDELELCKTAVKLNQLIEESSFQNVALRMIGGEVSIFNIEKILKNITSEKLKRVAFTTNFTQSSEYYLHLINYLKNRNIICQITASYHYETTKFAEYFKKIELLKDTIVDGGGEISCEMVNTGNNDFYINAFTNYCNQRKVDYTVDMDKRELTDKTNMQADDNFNEGTKKVYFSDGSISNIKFINRLFSNNEVSNIENKRFLKCKGFVCSHSYDYLVVNFNKIQGRTKDNKDCKQFINFEDFKWLPPSKCVKESCNLCGQMSLWKE